MNSKDVLKYLSLPLLLSPSNIRAGFYSRHFHGVLCGVLNNCGMNYFLMYYMNYL